MGRLWMRFVTLFQPHRPRLQLLSFCRSRYCYCYIYILVIIFKRFILYVPLKKKFHTVASFVLISWFQSISIITDIKYTHFLSHLPRLLYLSQAEKDLQPWIARDDEQGQKMWRVNQRIVKLIAELMRNHDSPEALVILASASDLLLRATDGMLVDGEACTLPQLEVTPSFMRSLGANPSEE